MKRKHGSVGRYSIALGSERMTSDAHDNLAILESAARDSIAFGDGLAFDAEAWKIRIRSANRRPVTLWFKVHNDNDGTKNVSKRPRLQRPFATFLKSVIRLSEAAEPKSGEAHQAMLYAGRYLHDQLARRGYDPAQLTTRDFQNAERASAERDSSDNTQFTVAQNLLKLARLVKDYKLSEAQIAYTPVKAPPQYNHLRVGPGRDPGLLPSEAALKALPQIAQQLDYPADGCMMNVVELLHCAPWRVGEVLSLPEDCEVVVSPDGGLLDMSDLDAGRPARYGLRYKPEKNKDLASDVKWIPSAAVPLARRAIANLRKQTAPAREVAAFMEANPGRAWLPEHLRENDWLTIDDVTQILGHSRNGTYQWLKANEVVFRSEHVLRKDLEWAIQDELKLKRCKIEALEGACRVLKEHPKLDRFDVDLLKPFINVRCVTDWLKSLGIEIHPRAVSRAELEARLLAANRDVSSDFPWKLSECLFLFRANAFKRYTRQLLPVVSLMRQEQLRYFLMGNGDQPGIFELFGYTEPNGDPIHVTSHMYRRWLATLAMDHEMSATEVQNWLGHSSELKQVAYDHRTPDQLGKEAREAIGSGLAIGPMADIAQSINEPRDRDTFLEAVLATAHITQYGMCARDWLTSPCVRHGACAACEKQLIQKGEPEHRKEIERSLRENRILLEKAKAEVEDGQVGAGNHARHLAREVAVLEATLEIHDSPSIADGTYVQLDPAEVLATAGLDKDK
ncbi:hypothetical protein [Bradyrhizobium sp. S3.9.1]|uniref:hypothetical protein n=1 Tax=Bradyrhizobium sp. S3.9.1 TaxID=3156431 RepID=UPI003394F524